MTPRGNDAGLHVSARVRHNRWLLAEANLLALTFQTRGVPPLNKSLTTATYVKLV